MNMKEEYTFTKHKHSNFILFIWGLFMNSTCFSDFITCRMPFKLKLKKSRHYSVVSKSLFVISVEILDGTIVECTLSSESTGQDCLDVVCQKLSLNQPKFFGLQYVSRNTENSLCWLELDKPIKRQLDKYARGLCVCLRVTYYVISGVRLFNDEVTRYV